LPLILTLKKYLISHSRCSFPFAICPNGPVFPLAISFLLIPPHHSSYPGISQRQSWSPFHSFIPTRPVTRLVLHMPLFGIW
jgi:hypothetical protein